MKTSFAFIVILLFCLNSTAQQNSNEFSVLFYNVENLFDTRNDSLTNDDEFTAESERHWTSRRLNNKLLHTSKVILNSAGWDAPTLVALCEIENRYVLERLKNDTPLKSIPYKIIHKESPDSRGIDVALLYNAEHFYPLEYDYYPLKDKNGKTRKTREVLYVSGILGESDTIHVFVNHWPSRYAGVMETRALRNSAGLQLREKIDLLFKKNAEVKIIVTGDFNDQYKDESLRRFLGAKKAVDPFKSSGLYNLSEQWAELDYGTLKYQSQWYVFDQFIVSGTLLNSRSGLHTLPEWASICNLPYLLVADEKYNGTKPFRTYTGYTYNGGFSDHLPILLKLKTH